MCKSYTIIVFCILFSILTLSLIEGPTRVYALIIHSYSVAGAPLSLGASLPESQNTSKLNSSYYLQADHCKLIIVSGKGGPVHTMPFLTENQTAFQLAKQRANENLTKPTVKVVTVPPPLKNSSCTNTTRTNDNNNNNKNRTWN